MNETARIGDFGSGAYPTAPSAAFNQVTAVGDPRSWQLALRMRLGRAGNREQGAGNRES